MTRNRDPPPIQTTAVDGNRWPPIPDLQLAPLLDKQISTQVEVLAGYIVASVPALIGVVLSQRPYLDPGSWHRWDGDSGSVSVRSRDGIETETNAPFKQLPIATLCLEPLPGLRVGLTPSSARLTLIRTVLLVVGGSGSKWASRPAARPFSGRHHP